MSARDSHQPVDATVFDCMFSNKVDSWLDLQIYIIGSNKLLIWSMTETNGHKLRRNLLHLCVGSARSLDVVET